MKTMNAAKLTCIRYASQVKQLGDWLEICFKLNIMFETYFST